jgi:DNA repair exonuclease SbcCD ATPase subunit
MYGFYDWSPTEGARTLIRQPPPHEGHMASDHNVSAAQRRQMIAEAAYFRAEKRGFDGGDALRDWCEAEAEVDARLRDLEDEHLVSRAEEALAAARKQLATATRKMAHISAEARAEWQREHDRLAALCDSLQPSLAEIRERGAHAVDALRGQVEKLRGQIAEVLQRTARRPH